MEKLRSALVIALLISLGACSDDGTAVYEDTGAPDTGMPDTGTPDLGTPDVGAPDAGTPDVGAPDFPVPDMPAPDQMQPDQMQPDMMQPDLYVHDQYVPDMMQPDLYVHDQYVPDMMQPDLYVHDQYVPDMMQPDQMLPDLPPPPTCTDGKKNGSETGVDCGGVCLPCVLGTGADGDLNVAKGKSIKFETLTVIGEVTAISGATISSPEAAKFKAGDEVMLINMQGTYADIVSVGNYEFFLIKSVDTNAKTVLVQLKPKRAFGNKGGNTDLAGQKVFMVRVPHFKKAHIAGTLTASPFKGTTAALGLVIFRSLGQVSVAAGGAINLTGTGYFSNDYSCNGVSGLPGESLVKHPKTVSGKCYYNNPTNLPNLGGGGGGLSNCNTYACSTQKIGAGGGGASHATKGSAGLNNGNKQKGGLPGMTYGAPELTKMFLGSGGGTGAGGFSGPGTGHAGGEGGGLIYITAPAMVLNGDVLSNGLVGGDNYCTITHGSGSGGGGAGGTIYLRAKSITLAGKVNASGGKVSCKGGGYGGAGRVRVDYGTLNGKSYPNASASVTTPAAYLGKF